MASLSLRLLEASEIEVVSIAQKGFELIQEGEYHSGGMTEQLEEDAAVLVSELGEEDYSQMPFPRRFSLSLGSLGYDPDKDEVGDDVNSYAMLLTGLAVDWKAQPCRVSTSGLERLRELELCSENPNTHSGRGDVSENTSNNFWEEHCRGAGTDGAKLLEYEKNKKTQSDEIDLAKESLERFSSQYVGVKTAAGILGKADRTVRQYASSGEIGTLIDGQYWFTLSELKKFKEIVRPVGQHKKYRKKP